MSSTTDGWPQRSPVPTKSFISFAQETRAHDKTVTLSGTYITTRLQRADIPDYNQLMFFWLRQQPEIHTAMLKSEDYFNFVTPLEAENKVETALRFNAK